MNAMLHQSFESEGTAQMGAADPTVDATTLQAAEAQDTDASPIKFTRPRTLRAYSRRPSEIEILVMHEGMLWDEILELQGAAMKLSPQNGYRFLIEFRINELRTELAAISEALTFQKPKTLREIHLMLNLIEEHTDGAASATDEQTRKARHEKVRRILESVMSALPAVSFLEREKYGFVMSENTQELLDRVDRMVLADGGPVSEAMELVNGNQPMEAAQ